MFCPICHEPIIDGWFTLTEHGEPVHYLCRLFAVVHDSGMVLDVDHRSRWADPLTRDDAKRVIEYWEYLLDSTSWASGA